MPKKSLDSKKGIQRTILRCAIGRKRTPKVQEGESKEKEDGGFLGINSIKLFSVGQKCFQIMLSTCEKLHLIGFTRTSGSQYVLLSRRGQLLHYAAITWCLAVFLQKTMGTIYLLLSKELQIQSFICTNLATIQVAAVLVAMGVIIRPKETIDLLNSWSYVSQELGQMEIGAKLDPLHDISTCCKVISVFFATQGIAVGAALLSLVMSDLPICLFPMAESFGWLPHDTFSSFTWQIMFAPLEWLTYFPPVLMAVFSACILFMGTGAVNICTGKLRMLRVHSLRSRQGLECKYVQLELLNRIFQVWIRFYLPTWLLGYAIGAILCVFITIRYTELPLIVYVLFPYVALTIMILLFWQCYDMIRVGRGSEDILGYLMQQQAPYLRGKSRQERVELMKRARAMRPLGFPIADCELSLSVPINTWEEVLNQVLFLLSL